MLRLHLYSNIKNVDEERNAPNGSVASFFILGGCKMEKTKIYQKYVGQPFAIAYVPEKYKIVWDWRNVVHARIGFMHEDFSHGFIRHVKNYARANQTRVLNITTEDISNRFMDRDTLDILKLEEAPTMEGMGHLERMRLNMVQLFFKSVCYTEGVSRTELIPQMQYYRNQEGPVMGYLRGIQSMSDPVKQNILYGHLERVRMVEMGIIYNELDGISDFVYIVNGNNLAELVESFIIGVWTIFVIHLNRQFDEVGMQRILTLVQLGEELVKRETDSIAKEIILEGVEMLAALTKPLLDNLHLIPYHSLLIQSSSLFPNIYNTISHMVYGKIQVSDFNLAEGHTKVVPFGPNEVIFRSKLIQDNQEFIARMKICIAE